MRQATNGFFASLRGVALAAVAIASVASAAQAGELKVVVTGLKSNEGQVQAMVCTEAQWLKTCTLGGSAPAKAGTTTVTIANLPAGKYGIVAYHDRNKNGKADQNFIGMPTEDVGFSNDALKGLSRPQFSVAAFDQPAGPKTITLKLNSFSK